MKTVLKSHTLNYFSGLLPFSGRCHIPNALWSYRIKTFYNLDKIHIIGNESQDSIFGGFGFGYFVIGVILREKLIHL